MELGLELNECTGLKDLKEGYRVSPQEHFGHHFDYERQ